MYSIGNEIPEAGRPYGARVGRALAEKVRSLDGTRFVTEAISGLLVGGPELIAELRKSIDEGMARQAAEPGEETGVNTAMTNLADWLNQLMTSPVVAKRSAETASYLDVAGYNYMESRFEMDGDLYPNRVDRGQRDPSCRHRYRLGGCRRQSPRHRRLHLDRLGLPGRGRASAAPSTANRERPRIVRLPRRVSLADRMVRRHRHHRSPPPAVVLPGDRLRAAARPLPRRAAARASRRGCRRDPVVVERRGLELELGWARGRAGDRGGLRRRRRGGAAR